MYFVDGLPSSITENKKILYGSLTPYLSKLLYFTRNSMHKS